MSSAIEWEDIRPYCASWKDRIVGTADGAEIIRAVLDGQSAKAGLPEAEEAPLRKSGTER